MARGVLGRAGDGRRRAPPSSALARAIVVALQDRADVGDRPLRLVEGRLHVVLLQRRGGHADGGEAEQGDTADGAGGEQLAARRVVDIADPVAPATELLPADRHLDEAVGELGDDAVITIATTNSGTVRRAPALPRMIWKIGQW